LKRNYFFLLIVTFLLIGCESISDSDEIVKVINLDEIAFNTRDVDLAISNYSSRNLTSEIRELQKESYENFEELGLTLIIEDIEVLYIKNKEAVVRTLNKYRTPTFNLDNNFQNDNDMLHFLIKEDGKWKYNYSYIVKRVFLNEDGSLDIEDKESLGWDESEIWEDRIKEMKDKNILPSEFMEDIILN